MGKGQSVGVYTTKEGKTSLCVDLCEIAQKTIGNIANEQIPLETRTTGESAAVGVVEWGFRDMCEDLKKNTGNGVKCTEKLDMAAPGSNPEDVKRSGEFYAKESTVLKEKAKK